MGTANRVQQRALDRRRLKTRYLMIPVSISLLLRQVEVIDGLTWTIPCGGGFTATAAQLQHRVPCWGYVFQEPGTPPLPDQALIASAGVTEVIGTPANQSL